MGALAIALASLTLTFTAPGHAPTIGASQTAGPHWPYTVKVTRAGTPLTPRPTVQIVHPPRAVTAGPPGFADARHTTPPTPSLSC